MIKMVEEEQEEEKDETVEFFYLRPLGLLPSSDRHQRR